MEGPGFSSRKGQLWTFSLLQRVLWGTHSLLPNGYRRLSLLRDKSGRRAKLTTHLHLVPRFRMGGAIPQLHQYIFMALCLNKQGAHLRGVVFS